MAENLVINGVTYNGVDSIEMNTAEGKKVLYFNGKPVTIVQEPGERTDAVMSQAAVTETIRMSMGGGGGVAMAAAAEPGMTLLIDEVDDEGSPTLFKAAAYQPRTHWEEMKELLPTNELEFIYMDGTFVAFFEATFIPDEGAIANVICNGVQYECTVMDLSDGVTTMRFIGNTIMTGGEDSGEPFAIMIMASSDGTTESMIASLDGSTNAFMSVVIPVIHRIPANYVQAAEVIDFTEFEFPALTNTDTSELSNDDTFNGKFDNLKKRIINAFKLRGDVTIRVDVANIEFFTLGQDITDGSWRQCGNAPYEFCMHLSHMDSEGSLQAFSFFGGYMLRMEINSTYTIRLKFEKITDIAYPK